MSAEKNDTIVHVGNFNGITTHYFAFLDENFDVNQHAFACLSNDSTSRDPLPAWSWLVRGIGGWWRLAHSLMHAEKIILHGLFSHRLVLLLFLMPWVLSRCYWVMWGGDFMQAMATGGGFATVCIRRIRIVVIRKIGYLLTYIPGDLELVRQRLKPKGKHLECIMYPSNVFKQMDRRADAPVEQMRDGITILMGNSADPSNEHDEIFARIQAVGATNYRLLCPLSYGNAANAERVEALGKRMFGDKFTALREFMSKEDYLAMLERVDIAVFAHRRQQGMGNIINLIGFGKKVYLRSSISSWSLFEKLPVRVYPLEELSFDAFDQKLSASNIETIEQKFSYEVLAQQWRAIFDS